jgi:hypothetical protein
MCCWKNIRLLFLTIAFSVCVISCTNPSKKSADSAAHQQDTTISYEKNGTESDAVWQLTREFYEWYVPAASKNNFTDLLDAKEMRRAIAPELLQALKRDSKAQKQDTTGNIVGLDFDPFLASQDPCEKYVVGKINTKGKSYWAEIHGVGGCAQHDSPDLFAEITKINKSWIISNLHYPKPATDLLNILAPLRQSENKLLHLNYQGYIGKPVGSLLTDLPIIYMKYYYLHEPPCVLQGCIFYFSNGKKLVVYITGQELQYLERFSKECTWDFEAFKKEKITDVELIDKNQANKRQIFQVSP